jgi:ribosomal protein S2
VVGFVEVEIPKNNSDKKALQVIVKTLEPASVLRAGSCRVK